jgi:hypothetical protein
VQPEPPDEDDDAADAPLAVPVLDVVPAPLEAVLSVEPVDARDVDALAPPPPVSPGPSGKRS